jgi:phage repressor protein C with HTH and peptisase S24 domain
VETKISIEQLKAASPEDALASSTSDGPGCEDKEPYALMVLGDSMEPEFKDGDVIVIEPGANYRDGSYVIAYHSDEYTFRQLRVIKGQWFLTPLNPNYVSEQVSGPEAIKGVITQKKMPGGRHNRKNYE